MYTLLTALQAAWDSISWRTLGWIIIDATLALVIGTALNWLIRFWGLRYAKRTSTASDDFLVNLTARVVQITVYLIGVLLVLGRLDYNLTPFLTGAGVFGLFLGLVGRDLFANTLAGLWLIGERPYDIGQRILLPKSLGDIHGSWGDVISIGLRSTHVLSVDGVMLTIPNSVMVNDTIANFGFGPNARMRARVRVGVTPEAENVRHAIEVAREAIAATPGVLEDPKPVEVLIRDFRDWDVLLEARFFVGGPSAFRSVKSAAIQTMLDAFEAQGIHLSKPVTQVAMTGGEPLGLLEGHHEAAA